MPTYDSLSKHLQKYGWGEPTRNSGKTIRRYSAYMYLAANPFVEVCFDYLSEEGYVKMIDNIDYHNFAKSARKDWRESRGLDEEDEE